MNKNAEKWVEDLRTTKEKQGRSLLHVKKETGDEFCCLGRACVLFIEAGNELTIENEHPIVYYADDLRRSAYVLPDKVKVWLGLKQETGYYGHNKLTNKSKSLAIDNDAGKTFVQIANIIEVNQEELFEKEN